MDKFRGDVKQHVSISEIMKRVTYLFLRHPTSLI
jgi:hypothetical protein